MMKSVLSLALAILFSLAARSAETFTPHHIARIRAVTAVTVSPDGSEVAYLLSVPRKPMVDDDGPAWTELHIVNANGESRPFITGKVSVSDIAWTPDGKGISYLAKRDKDEQKALYVIPLTGGESRKAVAHETGVGSYSWSADGKRVAFLATEPEKKDVKEQKKKGFSQEIFEEDLPVTKVWIATADLSGESTNKPRSLKIKGSASAVEWSPAGAQLAVSLAPTPSVDDGMMGRTVQIVNAESGEVEARFEHAAKLGEFRWSPDGRHIFTISGEDINDPKEGRLLLWSVKGGKPKHLLPNYEGHVGGAAWKDKDTITFIAQEGVWTAIKEVNLDGKVTTRVATGGPTASAISLSENGAVAALVADAPMHPGEVFFLGKGKKEPERLTASNPWLAQMRFVKQEIVTHKAADGLELQGILFRPLDEQPGRRYPLILAVHGGPESHVHQGWATSYSMPGQTAAAEGMAVFYPNYRGSTGRGVPFSKLGQGDAAGKEFSDLIDAIRHLSDTGLVDDKKVGITGGSYGGYASAWGATYYTEHFAASVMFVGISDNISKVGTTDIPGEMYHVHHRKRLWEDWDYFRDRSPIRYAEKSRTPTLILHGKDDPRVHPSQSLELHRHLKTLGKTPVRLVLYPGEGHGNRRAASRLDYSLRQLQWMKHYLKGPGGEPPAFELDYGLKGESDKK
jgi:dipeptidyl aminopeptidase/acylaminoacyl peptidase